MSYPTEKQIKLALEKIKKAGAARPLPPGSDVVDISKYKLCQSLCKYTVTHKLTLKEMASILKVDKAEVSKILNCHIDRFTLDRLIRLSLIVYQKANIEILL
jgi:predicted XRE-type DNA-binding protein